MSDAICTTEEEANAAARSAMGEVAWPTVVMGLALFTAYPVVLASFALGALPLWLATVIAALIVYATYTVVHDGVHGSISGQNRSLKWLNDALGYIGGQILGTSFVAHRKEHLAHHIHTNKEGQDPDLPLAGRSGWRLLVGAARALPHQAAYFVNVNWAKASTKERSIFVVEMVVAVAWRLALVIALGPVAAFFLLAVANFVGIFITLVLFAWIVHRPHTATGRYRDTSTFVFPKPFDTVISGLWLFQNYHAIHHLFPRVPFYRYRQVFQQIEPVMVSQGAPIHRWAKGRLAQAEEVSG